MSNREQELTDFLAAQGMGEAARHPLAGDASTRRYVRLSGPLGRDDLGPVIIMDAPPGEEAPSCPPGASPEERRALGYNALACLAGPDCTPFVAVAAYLTQLGLSAPKIYGADIEHGFLALEDLGDVLFTEAIAAGVEEDLLYAKAVDVLVELHENPTPHALPLHDASSFPLKKYDEAALAVEANLLLDWYLPLATGKQATEEERADYARLWQEVWPQIKSPPVLVLRDYHAQNLLWLPEREGPAQIGLLDFQDAVLGSPAYDLVSLLEDARRDVPADLARAMLDYYCEQRLSRTSHFDAEGFRLEYALLGVQRNAKIVGIFARLWSRDGKPHYLQHLPRVWRYLEGDLKHPALTNLCHWFDQHISSDMRRHIPSV